jgi:sulfite reductase (NADPH) hemoprotein beta-component
MAAIDDPKTLGRARLSFANDAEIDEFATTLARFERGELTADQWRVFRLVRGTYGQRQADDAQMIRVKIPQGVLTTAQLHALADIADQYSRGFGHITTRQNMQFHFIKLHEVELAMRRAAEAGLTTREACGNSVRNVTGCPYAGVGEDEVFDVTPYAEALTRYFLRHPLSSSLPRKFKIAFEGCREDHAKTAIHDIGWRAVIRDGRRGFRVLVGGGTAILCTSGNALFDFLPAGEMLTAAEAIVRVFHRLGDYQHKQRNRMKFLIKSIGWDAWRSAFEAAYAEVQSDGGVTLPFDPETPAVESAPDWPRTQAPDLSAISTQVMAAALRGPGIRPVLAPADPSSREADALRWTVTNVRRQKQPGFAVVTVTVPLGDLTGAQIRVLASLADAFADGSVRVTATQNLVFRWVPFDETVRLYHALAAAGLNLPDADTAADVTSCPGAESCKLAVTQSRGLGRALGDYLRARPALVNAAPDVDVKISGCPNGCGQHHIAGIGFQGSLRKVGDKAVPQYFVMVGGGVHGDVASFGRVVAKVPAHRCSTALDRLLRVYAAERRDDEPAERFFARIEVARIKTLLADLETLTAETATPEDFVDLGETTAFAPEMTAGECSA